MKFGLNQAKRMDRWIDEFNNRIVEAILVFELAVNDYLEGRMQEFEERYAHITELEHDNDNLRRRVEVEMYANTLIPESRGDVLSILENSDAILDRVKEGIKKFEVERPEIPREYAENFAVLAHASREAVEELVRAVHSFFKGDSSINNIIHKVFFYEREADRFCEKLKRQLFGSELDMAHKLHINRFIEVVEDVANAAEDVAERLAIYAIKRRI